MNQSSRETVEGESRVRRPSVSDKLETVCVHNVCVWFWTGRGQSQLVKVTGTLH